MLKDNRRLSIFQLFVGWIAFVFSIVSAIYLFSENSSLWLVVSLSFPFVIFALLSEASKLIDHFPLAYNTMLFFRSIFIFVIAIYFLSSIYGVYLLLDILPVNDKSSFFIPFIIVSFMFGGVSIELFKLVKYKGSFK